MTCDRLELTVESLPALRTPDEHGSFEYGLRLRLAGGPALQDGDPLLSMFGARTVSPADIDYEALQLDVFGPGRRVSLEIEFDADGDSVVGLWDAEGVRRAGSLAYRREDPLVAALDHRLALDGLVLREHVRATSGLRGAIVVLIHAPCLVAVTVPADLVVERPERATPQRVVLLADGVGEVGFWDPAVGSGPATPDELPLSPSLAAELTRLRTRYEELAEDADAAGGFEEFERSWARETLNQRAAILWRRARIELGRRFAVGFQGPWMDKPVWSPRDLAGGGEDDDETEIPF